MGEGINLAASVRFTRFCDKVFNASDEVQQTDGDFGVLMSWAEVDAIQGVNLRASAIVGDIMVGSTAGGTLEF